MNGIGKKLINYRGSLLKNDVRLKLEGIISYLLYWAFSACSLCFEIFALVCGLFDIDPN